MRRFSTRGKSQIEFSAATWPARSDAGRGDANPEYVAEFSGETVYASVQRQEIQALNPDGNLFSRTVYNVLLLDDPSGLNGGNGVRQNDAFRYSGKLLVCQGPVEPPNGLNAVWKVVCTDAE